MKEKSEHVAQKQLLISATSTNVSKWKASFFVVYHISKVKKSFTIGEAFVLPVDKNICCELFGVVAVKEGSKHSSFGLHHNELMK